MHDLSYEVVRSVAINILRRKEKPTDRPIQFKEWLYMVNNEINTDNSPNKIITTNTPAIHSDLESLFREVFWDMFRQGIITLGFNRQNDEFPFFSITSSGKQVIDQNNQYFFHDTNSYKMIIRDQVPNMKTETEIYLQEALQAYYSGCILAATVMLGVSAESTFFTLLDSIKNSPHAEKYAKCFESQTVNIGINRFMEATKIYKSELKKEAESFRTFENIDTTFNGIVEMIRQFRNESGHPSGKIITRETCFILLHLFISYAKKCYELIDFFRGED